MLAKKAPINIDDPNYRKRLEDLYARRTTIDTLIQTLEQYDRFQAKSDSRGKRKSA
jgi:hypothetical protein